MKKKWLGALAAMMLMVGFVACQDEVPPYLVIEDVDDEEKDFHGKVIMGVTDPAEVPAHVKISNGVAGIADAFKGCTSIESVEIPKSVKIIDDNAFKDCTSLASVKIPSSVTYIGNKTFSGCTSLATVTIADGVKKIGYEAFKGCTSLTSVNIPKSVEKIGGGAFLDCTSLASISIPV